MDEQSGFSRHRGSWPKGDQPGPPPLWTREDEARLITCHFVHMFLSGHESTTRIPTMFRLAAGAHAYVVGPIRVDELKTAGDGSYVHQGGFMIGTGPLGLALLPLSLAMNGIGNAHRRRQAQLDAQPALRFHLSGDIYVTNSGFVLCGPFGVLPWTTDAIDGMQVLPSGSVIMHGRSDRGRLIWHLASPWAQLIFAIWALRQYDSHPQLLNGSWMSQEWLNGARAGGRDPWLDSSAIHR